MKYLLRKLLLMGCIISSHVQSQYWAKIDYSKLQSESSIKIQNLSSDSIGCKISAFNDNVFLELSKEETSINIPVISSVRYHDLKLYCKPIKLVTKSNPWRINKYKNSFKNNYVFFPIK